MSNSLQPPPPGLLAKLGIAFGQWFQDTWKKLSNLQNSTGTGLYISGLTIQNNTPSGAFISWSACTVWLNGTPYPIAAGSSNSLVVWWNVGDTTFTTGSGFTSSPTTFGILSNNQGTADTIYNKVGAASVQADQTNLQPNLYNGPGGAMFTDVVFTSNPGTGVTWAAGNLYYKGNKYAISSGSCDNSHFWIYWQFSSPNAFQVSATYPAMAADDFLIGINGSSGSPGQLGNFARTFELRQANGQTVYITADGSIFAYNAEGREMWALSRSGPDGIGSSASGTLNLFDGNGTRWMFINGSDGKITTNRGILGTAGASAGYLDIIEQGGNTYKIQIFNP